MFIVKAHDGDTFDVITYIAFTNGVSLNQDHVKIKKKFHSFLHIIGWMHNKVAHFLNHNTHFCKVPFLWTSVTNNKNCQIKNLSLKYFPKKLSNHFNLDLVLSLWCKIVGFFPFLWALPPFMIFYTSRCMRQIYNTLKPFFLVLWVLPWYWTTC